MLKNYLLTLDDFKGKDVTKLTPSKFVVWAKNNIDKLITYKTGGYKTKLEDKTKYTLTITANDLQGNVSIAINFRAMSNPNSLSEYSIQYIFLIINYLKTIELLTSSQWFLFCTLER